MDMSKKNKIIYVGYYIDQNKFDKSIKENPNLSQARQNFETRLLSELVAQLGDRLSIVSYFPNKQFGVTTSHINKKKVNVFLFSSSSLKSCIQAFFLSGNI